jgi:hypothetical protein
MLSATQSGFNCAICNKPVDLEAAKVDGNGKAVHADCYLLSVALKQATPPLDRPPTS